MFDFTGTRFDLSVPEGLPEIYELAFSLENGAAFDLSGVSFKAVALCEGASTELTVEAGAQVGSLLLSIPALDAAIYEYELHSVSESLEVKRLIYGRITAISTLQADELMESLESSSLRTLAVQVPLAVGAPLQVMWRGSSVAGSYAKEAQLWAMRSQESAESVGDIIERAETAVSTAEEAVEKLDVVDAKLAMFDDKIASAVVPNPATNTWWIAGRDTFVRVTGENGRSPQISNVGTWLLWDDAQSIYVDTGEKAVPDNGHSPYISPLGTWVTYDPLSGWVDSGISAQGVDGLDGVSMRRVIIDSLDELPDGQQLGVYYYLLNEQDAFDVYAWLETADGAGSWVMIGEANDIATAEVHGLVKLGTDSIIEQGAAVGNDEAGGLSVSLASVDTSGAVVLSFGDVVDSGAAIGFDEDGKIRVISATMERHGSVRLSMSATAEDGCIGLMANGLIGTRRATLYQPGTVKLGSSIGQVNPQPYIIGVGATSDGQIANNILREGAIQHQRMGGWTGFDMEWLDESAGDHPDYYTEEDYYLGLVTSAQFSQSAAEGLTLLSASSSLLAGVYIATSISDARPEAVLSASGLSAHLTSTYYSKSEVYTKAEADTSAQTWARATFYTKNEAASKVYVDSTFVTPADVEEKLSGYVEQRAGWKGCEPILDEDYNNLESEEDGIAYFIY